VRQNVRRSHKYDLEFRLSSDHGPCYDLLRRTLRAHGTPFHGRRFFRLLQLHLGERIRFSEVRHDDRVVAAGVVVRFKKTIITPYIGSLHASRAMRTNYCQYWGLVEHCIEEGITRFEMGRSPRETTHSRFKLKWGCREVPIYYNYRMVSPAKPYRSVSRPTATQRMATEVWKRLPLAATTAIGPRLFRYIP
jgi:predicted N-acyltransferase